MKQLLISSLLAASFFVPAIQAETPTPAFKDYAVTDLFQEKATRLLQDPIPRFEYEFTGSAFKHIKSVAGTPFSPTD